MKRILIKELLLMIVGVILGLALFVESSPGAVNIHSTETESTATNVRTGDTQTFSYSGPGTPRGWFHPSDPNAPDYDRYGYEHHYGQVWTQRTPCPSGFSSTLVNAYASYDQQIYECAGK